MNPITFRDFLTGLAAAVIGGLVNGMAVAALTPGFELDFVHLKILATAAVVGGLWNASMYLKTPQRVSGRGAERDLSGSQAMVPTSKPEEIKP